MDPNTSRRSFIGGAVLLATGGSVPAAAFAAASPVMAPSSRLLRVIALHDRVEAECERFDVDVEMPARQACGDTIKALAVEPSPPHEESATTFINVFGERVRLSTGTVGTTAVARQVINDPSWADIGDEDWRQAHLEIAAAGDRRDAVLAEQAARRKALEEKARAPFRLDELATRSADLADRRYRLWWAAITVPAANLGDVVTKLAFIERTTAGDNIDADTFAAVGADIRRLADEVVA